MKKVKRYKHIVLDSSYSESVPFKPVRSGFRKRIPERDRKSHGEKLVKQFHFAWEEATKRDEERKAIALPTKEGIYLEIEGLFDYDLELQKLEDRRCGIKLLNVRQQKVEERTKELASIFIPNGKESCFLKKIREYLEEETKKGIPRNNDLIAKIENIRLAVVESFWQDSKDLLPKKDKVWCEIWIWFEEEKKKATIENFKGLLRSLKIEFKDKILYFPEVAVILAKCNL